MIAPPGHLRAGVNREGKNWEVMPPDLLGECYDFQLEFTGPERGNYFGGWRQKDVGCEFRIELKLRWTAKGVDVLQLLLKPDCNLSKRAQVVILSRRADVGQVGNLPPIVKSAVLL